jgi:integrase
LVTPFVRLLRAMDGYEGTLTVRCALRLAPLVFVRPGELRKAEWADIDLGAAEWRFTVTKTKTPRIVPLSRSHGRFLTKANEPAPTESGSHPDELWLRKPSQPRRQSRPCRGAITVPRREGSTVQKRLPKKVWKAASRLLQACDDVPVRYINRGKIVRANYLHQSRGWIRRCRE